MRTCSGSACAGSLSGLNLELYAMLAGCLGERAGQESFSEGSESRYAMDGEGRGAI